ncbi:hypothetical protein LEP1GSC021_0633 [Leptospira noguchii str. 1993005606]|uniref:Uncharacterized protein n=1 Tax=Leptospira noguchii str. 2007001578 TaxID=1049974 RepID=A0ABN0IY57_9LEPT|nr:hypothetical protein LEP1GSC035_1226 [Leptospira noguchii str. 2007001578]EPE82374.1 hypothetical protein LEP1GSC021_0633 [Leptospira noguchii str. 1993005606]
METLRQTRVNDNLIDNLFLDYQLSFKIKILHNCLVFGEVQIKCFTVIKITFSSVCNKAVAKSANIVYPNV